MESSDSVDTEGMTLHRGASHVHAHLAPQEFFKGALGCRAPCACATLHGKQHMYQCTAYGDGGHGTPD
eukprot:scaffold189405_cov22-Tisochrysis_lutea.AAC.1